MTKNRDFGRKWPARETSRDAIGLEIGQRDQNIKKCSDRSDDSAHKFLR